MQPQFNTKAEEAEWKQRCYACPPRAVRKPESLTAYLDRRMTELENKLSAFRGAVETAVNEMEKRSPALKKAGDCKRAQSNANNTENNND